MARTRGSARLPLPESLVQGLEGLGFQPFTPPGTIASKGTHTFVLMQRPTFTIQVVASNLPGESAVTAIWPGSPAQRIETDTLLRVLGGEVATALSPSQRASDILDGLGIGAQHG